MSVDLGPDPAYSDLAPPSEVGKMPVIDMVNELNWKQPRKSLKKSTVVL